jgi:hypothetical protein
MISMKDDWKTIFTAELNEPDFNTSKWESRNRKQQVLCLLC